MLALLAYTVLERQARQAGLALTTRRLIEQLDSLNIIETLALDGSRFYRLTPVSQEQAELIEALRTILTKSRKSTWARRKHRAVSIVFALPGAVELKPTAPPFNSGKEQSTMNHGIDPIATAQAKARYKFTIGLKLM